VSCVINFTCNVIHMFDSNSNQFQLDESVEIQIQFFSLALPVVNVIAASKNRQNYFIIEKHSHLRYT